MKETEDTFEPTNKKEIMFLHPKMTLLLRNTQSHTFAALQKLNSRFVVRSQMLLQLRFTTQLL